MLVVVLTLLMPPTLEHAQHIDFNRDVRPILFNKCVACHGPDEKERKGGLRLDIREDVITAQLVTPTQPDDSELMRRILSSDDDERMPPPKTGKTLSTQQIAILREWIRHGANYSPHWAYQQPTRPDLPPVSDSSWPRNAIDFFVMARLDREGCRPAPEADRLTLARRVALDLTGLPPTVEEADDFAQDPSPVAYHRYVDRQLAKASFGEHWARQWLDLARYADSTGYAEDNPRTIWAFRDFVIRSFNANKPFDVFTVEQIAGDLLPQATEDQRIATAFHRNTMTNTEGGTDREEFRNVAVVDRVNTTFAVWMGTSMACAQCHTHKYDPITQEEYFKVFAFFNNTADADRRDEAPVLAVGDTPEKKAQREQIEAAARQHEKLGRYHPALIQAVLKLQADRIRQQAQRYQPITTVPVQEELPANQRRITRIQYRGNFLDLGPTVTEGVPAAFHALPKDAPRNRLGFAEWLIARDNPLTARVTVNRFWEQIFGTGLVRTIEEFGTQGEWPSHPELLDWLAVEFMENNWDVKQLLKLIVTSATYRQSAKVSPEAWDRDPDNRLLARGPRFRPPAEVIRDQALFAAGLLSPKLYGPPVKPPQPAFGLNAAFGKSLDWIPSVGEDRYRRGLYTEWRRSNPYPSLATFDAPSREACTPRRSRTNTPLQALVTLNDPVSVEAAQALARLMAAIPGSTTDQVTVGFRRCLIRPPTSAESLRLTELYRQAYQHYANKPGRAARLATDPLGPAPANADLVSLAAWTVVANTMLNLDEMLLKP